MLTGFLIGFGIFACLRLGEFFLLLRWYRKRFLNAYRQGLEDGIHMRNQEIFEAGSQDPSDQVASSESISANPMGPQSSTEIRRL